MKFSKRHLAALLIMLLAVYFLVSYRLPYYIYRPGTADALEPIVKVEDGFKSKGSLHMVTVSGGQATPIAYALAKFMPHEEVLPINDIRPKGMSDDEYMQAQLGMMESSQQAATVVAYQAAKRDIDISYNGVYVIAVKNDAPASGKLQTGDRIVAVDDQKISKSEDLMAYIKKKQPEDEVNVHFIRKKTEKNAVIRLQALKELEGKPGLGIQLTTDRNVKVDPKVHFSSGDVGGPSAGLMFSLSIYDQLTKDDLTKGYSIAGTGAIDYDGNVNPIGGIDKKVIAADKEGCEVFFAPNENGGKDSNYQVAKATADEIGTDMKIVPVDSFSDALQYLNGLKPKQ